MPFTCDLTPGSSFEIDIGELLAVAVAHNKSTPPTATVWHYLAGVNFEPLWARFTVIMYILWP